jgi:hypothetical protein
MWQGFQRETELLRDLIFCVERKWREFRVVSKKLKNAHKITAFSLLGVPLGISTS